MGWRAWQASSHKQIPLSTRYHSYDILPMTLEPYEVSLSIFFLYLCTSSIAKKISGIFSTGFFEEFSNVPEVTYRRQFHPGLKTRKGNRAVPSLLNMFVLYSVSIARFSNSNSFSLHSAASFH